jgi:multiple sugar transport system permease protein
VTGERRSAFVFLLPSAALLGVFFVLPLAGTLAAAFLREPSGFAGLENFRALAADGAFRQDLAFSLLFVLVTVPLETSLGLVLALIVNEEMPGRGLWRAVLLVPWAVPSAVAARAWELIYRSPDGWADRAGLALGLLDRPVHWLGAPARAFLCMAAADVWKTAPFAAILVLAGLQGIPDEIYEQAQVDRANLWQRFRWVTLPLLAPALAAAALFRAVDALRLFDLAYVLTGGGPGGSTEPLSLYAYRQFLGGDAGAGAAASAALFLASLIFVWVCGRGLRRGGALE